MDEAMDVLTQLPVVGIFVWFQARQQTVFHDFMRDERQRDRETIDKLIEELGAIRAVVDNLARVVESLSRGRVG